MGCSSLETLTGANKSMWQWIHANDCHSSENVLTFVFEHCLLNIMRFSFQSMHITLPTRSPPMQAHCECTDRRPRVETGRSKIICLQCHVGKFASVFVRETTLPQPMKNRQSQLILLWRLFYSAPFIQVILPAASVIFDIMRTNKVIPSSYAWQGVLFVTM